MSSEARLVFCAVCYLLLAVFVAWRVWQSRKARRAMRDARSDPDDLGMAQPTRPWPKQ